MTIKPYIFNNYELTVPEKERGHYKSHQVEIPQQKENLEAVEGIKLTVDLTNVKDKEGICERFYNKLGFAKRDGDPSWDALGDYLWYFPESSGAFNEISARVVHIRVLNLNHIWKFSEKDYNILCEILMTSTDNSRFDDGFRMIIEVINS